MKQAVIGVNKFSWHTNLKMWTGDTLSELLEEWYHDFGELSRFYHI